MYMKDKKANTDDYGLITFILHEGLVNENIRYSTD
jgi:hypothetical protein